MEWNIFRCRLRLIRGFDSAALALALGVAPVFGCASALDQARVAWADGEGDLADAEPLYRDAMEQPKTREEARRELVAIYVEVGDGYLRSNPKKADDAYRQALELEPGHEEALVGRARALMGRAMPDDALQLMEEAVAKGGCRSCQRMLAVLLIERGERWASVREWGHAEQDYARALAIIPNAEVALDVVHARVERNDIAGAAEGLAPAARLIGVADTAARQEFLDLRRKVVLAALAKEKVDVAKGLLDLAPEGVGPEEQVGIAMEIALEMGKQGQLDPGIERLDALVAAAAAGKLRITADKLTALQDRTTALHISRAATRLAEGDASGAEEDLGAAEALRPDHPVLGLQRVLIAAATRGLPAASAALDKISAGAPGRAQVAAILGSLRVHEHLAAGRSAEASAELQRIVALAPKLPEVHVASAEVLAVSEVPGLKKPEIQALRSQGLINYPEGKVTRAGEALSELDWARQALANRTAVEPFRGPGTQERISQLAAGLGAFYPYEVKFHAAAEAVLVLANDGPGPVEVALNSSSGFEARDNVAAASKSSFNLPPGVYELARGRRRAVFVAEPYTQVQVPAQAVAQ